MDSESQEAVSPEIVPPGEQSDTPSDTESATIEPPKDDKFASKFAALARKERLTVEREKALSEREKQLQEKAQLIEAEEQFRAEVKANPHKVLERYGITYDELTRYLLTDGMPQPEDKLTKVEQEIQQLKELREQEKREAEESRLKAEEEFVESTIQRYKEEIDTYIQENSSEYELIIANNAVNDVYEVCQEYFLQTGKVLAPAEAAKWVENHYLEEAEKLLKLNKIAARVKPEPQVATETKSNGAREQVTPKTLTNNQVLSDPISRPNQSMTREERLKAAVKHLRYL